MPSASSYRRHRNRAYRQVHDYEGTRPWVAPASAAGPDPRLFIRKSNVLALAAHQALFCRGVTRSDFRYDDSLDAATVLLPRGQYPTCMTETSLCRKWHSMPASASTSWCVGQEDAPFDRRGTWATRPWAPIPSTFTDHLPISLKTRRWRRAARLAADKAVRADFTAFRRLPGRGYLS